MVKSDLKGKIHFFNILNIFCVVFTGERPTVKSEHAFVNVQTRGDLSSLTWYQSPLKHFSPIEGSTKQIYNVYYSALNFRDIMLATGKLPPDAIPGRFVL